MKLTKNQLRRMIIKEMRRINEDVDTDSFDRALDGLGSALRADYPGANESPTGTGFEKRAMAGADIDEWLANLEAAVAALASSLPGARDATTGGDFIYGVTAAIAEFKEKYLKQTNRLKYFKTKEAQDASFSFSHKNFSGKFDQLFIVTVYEDHQTSIKKTNIK